MPPAACLHRVVRIQGGIEIVVNNNCSLGGSHMLPIHIHDSHHNAGSTANFDVSQVNIFGPALLVTSPRV